MRKAIAALAIAGAAFVSGIWTDRALQAPVAVHPAEQCQEDELWTRFTPEGPRCVHIDEL